MKKIKTLILGLGRIATILEKDKLRSHPCTHSGVLFSDFGKKYFQVLGAYDLNQERISTFQKDWKIQKSELCVDLGEIQKTHFDLCIVATSSNSHFQDAKFAIQNKIQNVLIEKPICLNLVDLRKLKNLADQNKSNIWVNHERRYHPVYSLIRNLLNDGKLGDIRTIKASVLSSSSSQPSKNDIGPLFHDGTHAIDYIQWIKGKPKKIESKIWKKRNSNCEERIIANFEYQDGGFVFLEVGGGRKYFQFEIDIETTTNRIILSNDGHKFFTKGKSKLYDGFTSLRQTKFPGFRESQKNAWINLYSEIRDVHRGKRTEITGGLKDNLEILEILESIKRNSKRMN